MFDSDTGELEIFRRSVARFLDRHATDEDYSVWKKQGYVPPSFWKRAAEAGLLGISISETYGGGGGDIRHEAILAEEIYERGLDGFAAPLHNAMIAPYIESFGTAEQKARWLPGFVDSSYISALAMTEPNAGSDLRGLRTTARRDGDDYVINGQKTFISNGQIANLIVVACKTDLGRGEISLIVVETEKVAGFRRGRKLEKLGLEAADTSELFFDDVRVPASCLLGEVEGQGLKQLMQKLPQERLLIAIQGIGTIRRALRFTISHVKTRSAFGKSIIEFQNTQFKLAECKTQATIAEVFVADCIRRHKEGDLDTVTASMAKYWVSEAQCRIVDECLQLFGGYGYMLEYPIAQMYRDSRVQRIYGGTNEIMKMLIARSL
ncbi:acyl-CoA dehydrogenase family protein [Hyphomonas sp.]|uniref:acyl-CoA dehydrogenase family protein n=1 Tax=Hyphomonas sp. TaxID=87 RepID=UPI0037C082BB